MKHSWLPQRGINKHCRRKKGRAGWSKGIKNKIKETEKGDERDREKLAPKLQATPN
jgi:hypothetical protein